nr:hypothetical protein [Agrobacterium burrii]
MFGDLGQDHIRRDSTIDAQGRKMIAIPRTINPAKHRRQAASEVLCDTLLDGPGSQKDCVFARGLRLLIVIALTTRQHKLGDAAHSGCLLLNVYANDAGARATYRYPSTRMRDVDIEPFCAPQNRSTMAGVSNQLKFAGGFSAYSLDEHLECQSGNQESPSVRRHNKPCIPAALSRGQWDIGLSESACLWIEANDQKYRAAFPPASVNPGKQRF